MRCSESQQKIDALAAGELTPISARQVSRHVSQCPECAARLSDSRALNGELLAMSEEQPSDLLRDRVFREIGTVEGGAMGLASKYPFIERGEGVPSHVEAPSSRKRLRLKLIAQVCAACGICAVVAATLFPVFSQARGKARFQSVASRMTIQSRDNDRRLDAFRGNIRDVSGKPESSPSGLKFASQGVKVYNAYSQDYDEAVAAPQGGEISSRWGSPTANVSPAAPDRYLIRNAILVIEVKDARDSYNRLFTAVKDSKGYLSNLQETVDALGTRTITMQVRVPAKLFDSSMQSLSSLGKIMEKHVTAEDVTEEYVDTESTLRNLNRTEARLLEHLGRTGRLSDTLLVEKELTRVRQEIEQREGRLRFLSHRVQYSTLDVTLREEAKSQPVIPPASYSTGKEASEASRSLVEFLRSIWTMAIWIGVWAVIWAPLALVVAWSIRKAWRLWSS